MTTDTESKQLLTLWKKRAHLAQRAHYATAVKLDRRNQRIGISGVVLSALVGSTVFSMVGAQSSLVALKIVTGLVSLVAATITGVQTFRRDGEKAERHRNVAAKFSMMQRDMELLGAKSLSETELVACLVEFNEKYKQLISESPVADEEEFSKRFKEILSPPAGGVTHKDPAQ